MPLLLRRVSAGRTIYILCNYEITSVFVYIRISLFEPSVKDHVPLTHIFVTCSHHVPVWIHRGIMCHCRCVVVFNVYRCVSSFILFKNRFEVCDKPSSKLMITLFPSNDFFFHIIRYLKNIKLMVNTMPRGVLFHNSQCISHNKNFKRTNYPNYYLISSFDFGCSSQCHHYYDNPRVYHTWTPTGHVAIAVGTLEFWEPLYTGFVSS